MLIFCFWQVPVFKEDSYKEKIIICHCSCAWSVHMSYSYVFFTNWPSRDKSSWRSYRRWKSPVAFSFYAWICEYSYIHLNSCHRYPKLLEWLALRTVLVITSVTFRVTLKTINFLLSNELKTQQNLAHLFFRDCAPQNSNNFSRCLRKIKVKVV